ncbi:hypothetical protein ACQR0Z_17325 [Bradyrhizobium sp. HKCCYLS3077]|uniref:hypothetical protein n=1 Tax=unclassified Bradyrhizobium TaxID=2631580 RepID=UPI003EBD77BA
MNTNSRKTKQESFRRTIWTAQITLRTFTKSVFARRRMAVVRGAVGRGPLVSSRLESPVGRTIPSGVDRARDGAAAGVRTPRQAVNFPLLPAFPTHGLCGAAKPV